MMLAKIRSERKLGLYNLIVHSPAVCDPVGNVRAVRELGGFFYKNLREGDQPGLGFYVSVGADILFIISFFVLGAEFWGKLWALFNYNARVVVEETEL